jgi:thiamine monophosphate kinase
MLFNPIPSTLRPPDGFHLSRRRPAADTALFNENQYRIVITVTPENAAQAEEFLKSKNIPHSRLGTVVADQRLTIQATGKPFAWPLENLRNPHEGVIPSLMTWEN